MQLQLNHTHCSTAYLVIFRGQYSPLSNEILSIKILAELSSLFWHISTM